MNLPSNKSGFALLLSIFLILAFAVLGLTVLSIIPGLDTDIWIKQLASSQALYLAESARNFSQEFHLPWGTQFSNTTHFPNTTTKTLSNGTFTIAYSNRQAKTVTASFQGNVGTCKRKLQINYDGWTSIPAAFKYVGFHFGPITNYFRVYKDSTIIGDVYVEDAGTFELGYDGASSIQGNLYVKGNVIIRAGSSVTGNVYLTGTLTNQGTIGGTVYYSLPSPTPQKPILTTTYFDRELALAQAQPAGDVTWSGKDFQNRNWYINGNLFFRDGTYSGTPANVVATGSIEIWTGLQIGQRITLISNSHLYVLNSGVQIGGGQSGAGCILYAKKEFQGPNNQTIKGCILGGSSSPLDWWGGGGGPPSVLKRLFWGLCYRDSPERFDVGSINAYGSIGSLSKGTSWGLDADLTYDSTCIPLCVRGLYGVQRGVWQETSQ